MKSNKLLSAPPQAVTDALTQLGQNIRTARLRRKLRMEDLAERIGISRQMLADVENGKASTNVAAYFAALWALDLLEDMRDVADPAHDEEGMILERLHSPNTAGKRKKELDNDF